MSFQKQGVKQTFTHEQRRSAISYDTILPPAGIHPTYEALAESLPDSSFLGAVRYIDYETETFDPALHGYVFTPLMYKRLSFEHEREVRAIMFNPKLEDRSHVGQNVPVDLKLLISKIHISPQAPVWFYDLVVEACRKYEIDAEVQKSDLHSNPLF